MHIIATHNSTAGMSEIMRFLLYGEECLLTESRFSADNHDFFVFSGVSS